MGDHYRLGSPTSNVFDHQVQPFSENNLQHCLEKNAKNGEGEELACAFPKPVLIFGHVQCTLYIIRSQLNYTIALI